MSERQWISSEVIVAAYHRIALACARAGLNADDAQDVAQDIWLWLLRSGKENLASEFNWLGAVVQNYVRRYQRRRGRRTHLEADFASEAPSLEAVASGLAASIEFKELLDQVSSTLTRKERRFLVLIRMGHTPAEAGRLLGIRRGSRASFVRRVVERGRQRATRPHRRRALPKKG
jgi:DNA-directed RNA polymerase specialized sigma24 family protein